ncbi:MAG: hypothetical protein MN733_28930 [Nitrososphaera sp.]|nr:hypothetical protein [Nitrososphaera sp.]
MTTHAGTGLFCLVRFINLFFREVFFRAGIYERKVLPARFLSVGVASSKDSKNIMRKDPASSSAKAAILIALMK